AVVKVHSDRRTEIIMKRLLSAAINPTEASNRLLALRHCVEMLAQQLEELERLRDRVRRAEAKAIDARLGCVNAFDPEELVSRPRTKTHGSGPAVGICRVLFGLPALTVMTALGGCGWMPVSGPSA